MLSKNAFNAFLKTLEEPPDHVKFIFATTEIRKVPITVLSRCQRFDLARFDGATLAGHLGSIAKKEGVQAEEEALMLLSRAAQGSVRDGLSLLDQAILSRESEAIEAEAVRRMIGLADRGYSWALFEAALKGETGPALEAFRHQYDYGADPAEVVRDLLDVCHLVTRTKAAGPDAAAHGPAGTSDAAAAKRLAEQLAMPALTRTWSLLMKALEETRAAPDPAAAAEVGLIRLAYASTLPTPAEVLAGRSVEAPGKPEAPTEAAVPPPAEGVPQMPEPEPAPLPVSLREIADLAGRNGEMILRQEIEQKVRLISLEGSKLTIAIDPGAKPNLPGTLQKALISWTGAPWDVEVGGIAGAEPTLKEQRDAAINNHPLVKETLRVFEGASIAEIRPLRGKEDGQ